MKKLFVATAFLLGIGISGAQAQSGSMGSSYQTALGVKFYPGAISIKHFVGDNRALEGLASFWRYGMRITGLYEIHGDINGAPGLKWYVGPGAHIGFWNDKGKNYYYNGSRDGGAYVGVDGVLGLDYKINGAPLNLSLDWQPSFSFGTDHSGFDGGWGGFAIRYTF
ncbi:MAG: hypothetical protein ACO1NW_17150 [Chitinophagaceae bacterium]